MKCYSRTLIKMHLFNKFTKEKMKNNHKLNFIEIKNFVLSRFLCDNLLVNIYILDLSPLSIFFYFLKVLFCIQSLVQGYLSEFNF